jgi:hypothetical protein
MMARANPELEAGDPVPCEKRKFLVIKWSSEYKPKPVLQAGFWNVTTIGDTFNAQDEIFWAALLDQCGEFRDEGRD